MFKRIFRQEEGCESNTNKTSSFEEKQQLEDCEFLDNLYPTILEFEESEEFVAAKIHDVESEIDNLPISLKAGYYAAIEQDIKQKANYVRSNKFLLMFLRADSFDVSRASIRVANFFNWKMQLFGLESLPRPIYLDDLNENDIKGLSTQCNTYGGVDCAGRPILFIQPGPLFEFNLFEEEYAKSFLRVSFYVRMCIIEGNDHCQKKGIVAIRWALHHYETTILKTFRISKLISQVIKMIFEAIPMKLVATHDCRQNALANTCLALLFNVLPKHIQRKNVLHLGDSPATHFSALSQYGIDVNLFPDNITGTKSNASILDQLKRLQHKQLTAVVQNNDDIDDVFMKINNGNERSINTGASNDKNIPEKEKSPRSSSNNNNSNKTIEEFDLCSLDLLEILQEQNMNKSPPYPICWSRDGNAIEIHKREFSEHVLKKKFSGIKYDSFIRKLFRCGFKRLADSGPHFEENNINCSATVAVYGHPLFQRNSKRLLDNWKIRDELRLRGGKFPVKLMKVLELHIGNDAIWWVCNGNAFAIDKSKIATTVLGKYFKGLRVDSFCRILRKWEFKRVLDEEKKIENNHQNSIQVYHNAKFKKNVAMWDVSGLRMKIATPQANFFEKLYGILENTQITQDAIWWLDDGKAIAIHIVNFTNNVIPTEFKGIKFRSFRRNLARWKFEQLPCDDDDIVIFHNPKFQRKILH